jgi:hypothetical protein
MKALIKQIKDFADSDKQYGWLVVNYNGKEYSFPKRALIHYVFGYTAPLADIIPEYEPFSPSGMKCYMDNRFHTEVWLAAGFDLNDAYEFGCDEHSALQIAIKMIEEEWREKCEFDFTVLANGLKEDYIHGLVYDYLPPLSCNIHIQNAKKRKEKGMLEQLSFHMLVLNTI